MRVSYWWAGFSAAAAGFAALVAGCSSSSSASLPSTTPDASEAAEPTDASSTTCHVDASLTVFAASDAAAAGCAECVQTSCKTAIDTCASDCTCIDFFACIADSGVATSGLGAGAISAATTCAGSSALSLLTNPGISGLVTCLSSTCAGACAPPGDGGEDSEAPDAAAPATDSAAAPVDAPTGG